MKGWSKGTVYLAVVLTALGFLLIVLAWNGAAERDFIQGQFPYLLSGGLTGLGMIVAGMSLAVVQELRKQHAATLAKLDELVDAVVSGGGATGAGPTAVPEGSDHVVAGRTTYHSPTCHLVEGRGDLQVMSPSTARDRGLAPCRICEPQQAESA